MNLGRTLVGAIIGAALAIGIYLALKVGLSWQAAWFPIVTGLFVGLGVRQANKSLAGHVSYLRGAVAGLIAAGAILCSDVIAEKVFTRKAAAASTPAASNQQFADPADDDKAAQDDADSADESAADASDDASKDGEADQADALAEQADSEDAKSQEEEGATKESNADPKPRKLSLDASGVESGAPFAGKRELGEQDVLPFIFMAVGIFLAYEFARGTSVAAEQTTPAPVDQETDRGDE